MIKKSKLYQYIFLLIITLMVIFNGGNNNLYIQFNFVIVSIFFLLFIREKNYLAHVREILTTNKLAIIGGSGLYDVEEFKDRELLDINTSWGKPSDQILKTNYNNKEVYFLPRHGRGHFVSPSNINFRANIDALKQLGVTDIVSVSAVGSLKEDLPPGKFVIVDQFIDRTFARTKTFFDDEIVQVCNALANLGVRVIVAGLDMDFEGKPFGPMPALMATAEYVTKVHAVCTRTGNPAHYSFRKSDLKDLVVLGEKENYEPISRAAYNKAIKRLDAKKDTGSENKNK